MPPTITSKEGRCGRQFLLASSPLPQRRRAFVALNVDRAGRCRDAWLSLIAAFSAAKDAAAIPSIAASPGPTPLQSGLDHA